MRGATVVRWDLPFLPACLPACLLACRGDTLSFIVRSGPLSVCASVPTLILWAELQGYLGATDRALDDLMLRRRTAGIRYCRTATIAMLFCPNPTPIPLCNCGFSRSATVAIGCRLCLCVRIYRSCRYISRPPTLALPLALAPANGDSEVRKPPIGIVRYSPRSRRIGLRIPLGLTVGFCWLFSFGWGPLCRRTCLQS